MLLLSPGFLRKKIEKYLSAIEDILSRNEVALRELQSLTGVLNFACHVFMPGRVFLQRLIKLTIGVKHPNHSIHLTQEVKQDLIMWESFFQSHNSKSIFLEDALWSSSNWNLFIYAAWSLGFVIVFNRKRTSGRWPTDWTHENIAFLELFPIVLGVRIWAESLANKWVLLFTDNESIIHVINCQTSNLIRKELLYHIYELVLTCLQHNILFRARHIQGKKNTLADSLSCLEVLRFKALASNVEESQSVMTPHLLPHNWGKFWAVLSHLLVLNAQFSNRGCLMGSSLRFLLFAD